MEAFKFITNSQLRVAVVAAVIYAIKCYVADVAAISDSLPTDKHNFKLKLYFDEKIADGVRLGRGECIDCPLICTRDNDDKIIDLQQNTALTTTPTTWASSVSVSLTSDCPEIAIVTPTSILSTACPTRWEIRVCATHKVGHTVISAESSENQIESYTYLQVDVYKIHILSVVSDVCGWIYFTAWSVSFYPQVYENYQQKSVIGLNFDFLALNVVGFTLYSLFNCALYFSADVQREYSQLFPMGVIPVMFNDVLFSVHASFISAFTIFQCFLYEQGTQRVSNAGRVLLGLYAIIFLVSFTLASTYTITWLQFLYNCSYIKLSITLVKYIPQAYMNYKRKSTKGWSIGNILLDFTGGIFSMLQMFINSYLYDDWASLFGHLTKFGLGLFSVAFDVFFMYQHYVLYRGSTPPTIPSSETQLNVSVHSTDNKLPVYT